jgi:hypothetical protein
MAVLIATVRLARRAIGYELRMWSDLVRWVLRRPVCAEDETPFGYARAMTPIVGGFIAVMKQTNVDLVLRGPTTIELPRGETEPLRGVNIAVDEPAAIVAAIRERLDPTAPSRSSGLGRVTEYR